MSETETNESPSVKAAPPPAVDPPAAEPPPVDPPKAEEKPKSEPPPAAVVSSADSDAGYSKKKKKKDVEYAVRLNKITKRFGNKTAVDGVSLKIKQGSVYGLIGPNGAGKTTTFSMMAGFLRPTEGTIEMLGYGPTQVDELRARVGVLPQDAVLPPTEKVGEFLVHMARLQNIPADKAETAAREVLAEVDGRDWWNVRCSSLSHGMAKRVALAQAIMGEPEIVLLDEPTAGLDPRVAYEVRQLVRARKGRCTLIVSSHNLQELEEICDGAAILDRGRVIESGSMSQLTAANQEIHIKISPTVGTPNGGPHRSALASIPMDAVRAIPSVTQASFDTESDELVVNFDRRQADAETVIGQVLWCLLNNQVRISGVSKGKGLEQRVMELTE
jgi:ABC-2 type transport system ATP-binding protein